MEERLDDALNVLRNHCEPQLGMPISSMDGAGYVGSPPIVNNAAGSIASQENAVNEPPPAIKLERLPSNASEYTLQSHIWEGWIITANNNFFS